MQSRLSLQDNTIEAVRNLHVLAHASLPVC